MKLVASDFIDAILKGQFSLLNAKNSPMYAKQSWKTNLDQKVQLSSCLAICSI